MMSDTVASAIEIEENLEDRAVVFEEALEAILFAAGHPISYATLARVFEITPGQVKDSFCQDQERMISHRLFSYRVQ